MNKLPTATVLIFSLLSLTTTSASPSPPPPPPPPPLGGCSDSVISISPCLPFISDPPNNLSSRPSSQCCDLFAASFQAGEAVCLCYLVRGSMLLGFPVNATKLLSLSSRCPHSNNSTRSSNTTTSLRTICSVIPCAPVAGSLFKRICASLSCYFNAYRITGRFAGAQKLPPLMSPAGPDISRGHSSGSDNSSSPLTTTTPILRNSSSRQPNSLPMPTAGSSTSQEINSKGSQFLPEIGNLLPLILFFF